MRALAIALALAPISNVVWAQTLASTLTMTCAQAQNLVQSRGTVTLNTGRSTWDLFVNGIGGCSNGDNVAPSWVQTRDTPECGLYVCRPRTRGGGGG
jgi:hypothetical protein